MYARAANDVARPRQTAVGLDTLGKPKIGDPRPVVSVDQHILGLQVAVQDPALMRKLNRFRDDLDVRGGLLRRKRIPMNDFGEVFPGNEIHREILLPFVLAYFVDGDDVRMLKIGSSFRFRAKTLPCRWSGQLAGENHLQCDGPVEAHLPRFVDDSHPAPGDLFEDLIVAEIADLSPRRRAGRVSCSQSQCRVKRGVGLSAAAISNPALQEASRAKTRRRIKRQFGTALRT
jgi:hypothetical protein